VLTHSSLKTALFAAVIAGLMALPSAHVRADDASSSAGCDYTSSTAPYGEVQIDTYPRVNLRLARTEQEREQGLMFVDNMAPDDGMLFVYTSPSTESYWMYHTDIPLSIAWIDQNGTILDIQDMPRLNNPDDQTEAAQHVYTPAVVPYWYALEVNEGWFVQHGVGVGQQILVCLGGA
jgi:uncharacterized membrane protein (UPF0127 family)